MRPYQVLLVGNPNVGKSTVFNGLTGRNQHTGNWSGKTVELAHGEYRYKGRCYELVDLPGSYSLDACSREEQVTQEAVAQGEADCVVVVCDGTCLRRNLILVYQVLETCRPVVVLVNLMDEAERRGLNVDCEKLGRLLGVPVLPAAAGKKQGLAQLQEQVRMTCDGFSVRGHTDVPRDRRRRATLAEETAAQVVSGQDRGREWLLMWDRLLTGRKTGLGLMLLGLFFLLWLTIAGANLPSELLWKGILWCYGGLKAGLAFTPWWFSGALLDGMLLTAGRVISVMLPPMAIFFPLFTLLEDLGYLPRVAYNLDRCFERAGSCGKMGLSMCMGLGCNAVGVMGTRIIDSPRERLLGIVTNSFVPCNGRFGGLILLMTAFLIPAGGGTGWAALGLTGVLVLSFLVTMVVSKLLSCTILKGMTSGFVLELPPYRRPDVAVVLVRSVLDRTVRVLGRAALTALPTGLVVWCLSQITVNGDTLLLAIASALEPVGGIFGLSGVILLAFVLGTPANEIVLPMVLLILSGSFGIETESSSLAAGLSAAGFDFKMALCTGILFLFHWPCATTLLTIRKETGSLGWMAFAVVLPTAVGLLGCLLVNLIL